MGSLVPSEDCSAAGLGMTPVPVTWTSRLGSVEVSIWRMAAIWSSTEPATTGAGTHCQVPSVRIESNMVFSSLTAIEVRRGP